MDPDCFIEAGVGESGVIFLQGITDRPYSGIESVDVIIAQEICSSVSQCLGD